MVDAEFSLQDPDAQRRRFVSVSYGLALGLVVDLAIVAGLVYLEIRDTSDSPWETLSLGAFGAACCFSPVQLAVSAALTMVERIRWLSVGLVAAAMLGAIALIILGLWSGEQAGKYAELHGLT